MASTAAAATEVHFHVAARGGAIVVPSAATLAVWDPPWREPLPPEWIHGELPALVTGELQGRTSAEETTVFVGSSAAAMWDVVAASVFYEAGRNSGCGTEVDISS